MKLFVNPNISEKIFFWRKSKYPKNYYGGLSFISGKFYEKILRENNQHKLKTLTEAKWHIGMSSASYTVTCESWVQVLARERVILTQIWISSIISSIELKSCSKYKKFRRVLMQNMKTLPTKVHHTLYLLFTTHLS